MRLASFVASASGLPSSRTISAAIAGGTLGQQAGAGGEELGARGRRRRAATRRTRRVRRRPPRRRRRRLHSGATVTTSSRSAGLRRVERGAVGGVDQRSPMRFWTDVHGRHEVALGRHVGGGGASCPTWRSRRSCRGARAPPSTPAWQQAMSSLVWPPRHADPADHFAVDLDRPAADEDGEPAAVHVHDAEGLLAGLGVGVGVRRPPVAGGGERLVDGDLDARRLGVVGTLDDDRPAGGVDDRDDGADAELAWPWRTRRRRRSRPPPCVRRLDCAACGGPFEGSV